MDPVSPVLFLPLTYVMLFTHCPSLPVCQSLLSFPLVCSHVGVNCNQKLNCYASISFAPLHLCMEVGNVAASSHQQHTRIGIEVWLMLLLIWHCQSGQSVKGMIIQTILVTKPVSAFSSECLIEGKQPSLSQAWTSRKMYFFFFGQKIILLYQ